MNRKTKIIAVAVTSLLAVLVMAWNPSDQSFDTNHFIVTSSPGNFKIRINTNNFPVGGVGQFVKAGTNVNMQTNGNVVTVNANVSHTEVTNVVLNATNKLDTDLRALIGGAATNHVRPTFYVDSVNGSDSNRGTNSGKPFLTLAKITNVISPNGIEIRLARGARFREELILGTNNFVGAYGSGPRPIVDASDVASNAGWSRTAGRSFVWERSWTPTGGGSATYLSAVENGVQLINTNSIANCDTVAGTYFVATVNDPSAGVAQTIYIHPRGNTSPTNDSKLYEIGKRNYALFGGDNNTVEDVHTRNNMANNGSIELRRNGRMVNVLAENGTKHNNFLASGVRERCVVWKQEYSLQTATMFVSHDTIDGGKVLNFACVAMDAPAATAFFSHTATNGYAQVYNVQCTNLFTSSFGSDTILTNGVGANIRCASIGHSASAFSFGGGTNIYEGCFTLRSPYAAVSASSAALSGTAVGGQLWVAGNVFAGNTYGINLTSSTNVDLRVYDNFFADSGASIRAFNSSNIVLNAVSNNIILGFPAYDLTASNYIAAAGSNVFQTNAQFVVAGTTYTSFGAYQAALPAIDIGSVTNSLKIIGDPNQGDAAYANSSPAVTNLAGPGWRLPPRPATVPEMEGVPGMTSARLASGYHLREAFEGATNLVWSIFLKKTNDTATALTVESGFTNAATASAPPRIHSTGNLDFYLQKSVAGNDLTVHLGLADGTDKATISVDSSSVFNLVSLAALSLRAGSGSSWDLRGGGSGAIGGTFWVNNARIGQFDANGGLGLIGPLTLTNLNQGAADFALGVKRNPDGSHTLTTNDVPGGSGTTLRVQTNGVTLLASATNLNFVDGAGTVITGHISGATAIIGVSTSGSGTTTNVLARVATGGATNRFDTEVVPDELFTNILVNYTVPANGAYTLAAYSAIAGTGGAFDSASETTVFWTDTLGTAKSWQLFSQSSVGDDTVTGGNARVYELLCKSGSSIIVSNFALNSFASGDAVATNKVIASLYTTIPFSSVGAGADNLGNHAATQDINGGGNGVTNVSGISFTGSGNVLATGTNGWFKLFGAEDIIFDMGVGGANTIAVTSGSGMNVLNFSGITLQQSGTAVALQSRNIATGAGLSGGGNLSADRTLTWAPATQVNSFTIFDGSQSSREITFNLSGTDIVLTLSSGLFNLNSNFGANDGTFTGDVSANSFTGSGSGLSSLNADNLASGTVANARLPAIVSVSGFSTFTNLWTKDGPIYMGTNSTLVSGATTCGITGISNKSAGGAVYDYAELQFVCTGDVTFTNHVDFVTSDGADSRTFTNGNTYEVVVKYKPGLKTNMIFTWSK